jgi:phospholipid N-methyltransferase
MAIDACSEYLRFLRSLIADPRRVAAIAPSSEALSRLMTSEVLPSDGPVLELGPGTGAFTRALLARGVRESDLTLVENGSEFLPILHERFPAARVLHLDAAQLARCALFPESSVAAVVSGLPMLSMPPRKVLSILSGAFAYLRPTGCFYQFTYGPRCPVPRPIVDRLGLKSRRIAITVRNLPPAAVYRFARRHPYGVGPSDAGMGRFQPAEQSPAGSIDAAATAA